MLVLRSDHAAQAGPRRGEIVFRRDQLALQFVARPFLGEGVFEALVGDGEFVDAGAEVGGADLVDLLARGAAQGGLEVFDFLAQPSVVLSGDPRVGRAPLEGISRGAVSSRT
ncbi:hypothetical protein [Streptomyces sp. NPDC088246]|uniref:hypothetical protein n=1 Tax=Streptomyces sp. NPDC088246 TaxID=3365842 RepID=UPI00381F4FD2